MLRAVIDTNIWVSTLLNPTGYPAKVLAALLAERFALVISPPLLAELRGVMTRERFRRRYAIEDAHLTELLRSLTTSALSVEVRGEIQLCRDPKDNMVIETAINGQADVIVSRDEDLSRDPDLAAALTEYGIRVLTVERFLRELDEEP